ncbi:MAG: M23 family peptidase [Arcobacter sp.]|nr:MAG: M23 family peptidase [Arcobacter sp.]
MKKIIPIILLLIIGLNAINISSQKVKNANTVLVSFQKKDISNPKLTFNKQHINFFKSNKKEDTYYALVPISYYEKVAKHKIIISYIKDGKKIFKGVPLEIIDGKYKSEVINVPKGKVSLSQKDKLRTKKEYSNAIKIYNTINKELYFDEKFIYPLATKITSDFGKKRVYNGIFKSYHSGTDFKAAVGTPIKASNNGIVVISGNRFYAGNSIVIDHGQGIYSCYFHLSKMNYKTGDFVKKGEIVGLSGSTGRVTGPHLHFSFRVHGMQVDPLQLINLLNNYTVY